MRGKLTFKSYRDFLSFEFYLNQKKLIALLKVKIAKPASPNIIY